MTEFGEWVRLDRAVRLGDGVVPVGGEFIEGSTGRRAVLEQIHPTDARPYVVRYNDSPEAIRRYRGDLSVIAHRVPTEIEWEELDPRQLLRTLDLQPGDLFKRINGLVYEFITTQRTMYGLSYKYRRQGASGGLLQGPLSTSGGILITAVCRRSAAPNPIKVPKVTEVVCTQCGRTLGEFSDGTTPRSVLGDCCKGTRTRWDEERMVAYLDLMGEGG